ncbi:MAG TPA: hypothetical protein VGB37_00640 [Candidatus Lokiarchaeia archaeon]
MNSKVKGDVYTASRGRKRRDNLLEFDAFEYASHGYKIKKMINKCVAVNPKVEGYTEAIVDDCSRIKQRLEQYTNYGEFNLNKKIYKLGNPIKRKEDLK